MAKFIFRLQSFLSLKEKIEDQCRMEYGKAISALEAEKQKKAVLETERRERLSEFSAIVRQRIEPQAISGYNMYIDVLKQRIADQQIVIDKAEKIAEEKRLALIEAMKEKKMLQTLKEKDHEEFIIEEKRQEQRVVDEVVSYKYANGNTDNAEID